MRSGLVRLHNLKNVQRRRRKLNVMLLKKWFVGYHLPAKKSLCSTLLVTMPHYVNYAIIHNVTLNLFLIYIYDANYSFVFTVEVAKIDYLRWYHDTNTLYIKYLYTFPFFKMGSMHLRQILHIFYTMFFGKLRVRGRMYRIYKRNKFRDIQYRLGYTHDLYVYTLGLYVKYIRKKQIRLIGYDWTLICQKLYEVWSHRPLSIYTGKGVQISKNRYYRRVGKVSTW